MPKGRILVVDDDADLLDALETAIADEGLESAAAHDGQEALDWLRAHPAPALILLDWNMAPMNGPQFMAEMARVPELSGTPVVLVTADARAPEKAKSNGIVGYLTKPIDLDALLEIVDRYAG